MAETWVVSDTHFGHKNIINFGEMRKDFTNIDQADEAMVEAWNSVVHKRDVVLHLGDVAWNVKSFEHLRECHGQKKLILGNHDTYSMDVYSKYFLKVYGSLKKGEILFTHIPIIFDKYHMWEYNVHGHIHHKEDNIPDWRYYNDNVDVQGMVPVNLDYLISYFKHRKLIWMETRLYENPEKYGGL